MVPIPTCNGLTRTRVLQSAPTLRHDSGEAMKSTAAVAHSLRSPFVVEEIELPDLQHTDVLVRIVAVGICHTDIASKDGQLPAPFPAIFGHEGAGVVEQVGKQVRKVTP